jgi:hypothetical protein
MRRVSRAALGAGLVALVIAASASSTDRAPFPGQKLDLRSFDPTPVSLDSLSVTGQGAITGKGRPPRVGPNIRVNAPQQGLPNGLFGRSETSLTIDRNNIVAGWNDAQGFCGPPFGVACTPQSPAGLSGYAYSTDQGRTWTDGGGPDPFGGVLSRGDPWLDDNAKGTYYYANLAVDQTTAASLGVGVWRGSFSGSSFAWSDVKTFDSPENAVTPDFDFYDKEAIIAGKGRYANDAYVSLTNFQGFDADDGCPVLPQFGFGQIEVWRTHDGGATWQGPAIAGPEAPDSLADCGFTGTVQQSSVPAIGTDGSVYVVWQYGPFFAADGSSGATAEIRMAKSTDGGATFGPPVTIATINSMRATPPIGYNRERVNDHPRIEISISGSQKHKGRIWVTYYSAVSPVPSASAPQTQQSLVSTQVYAKYSDNGGATWSSAIPMPGSVGATGTKRWWPDIVVGHRGDVQVFYYEEKAVDLDPANPAECPISIGGGLFRNGPYSSLLDVYWTYDKTGDGNFASPIKVTEVTTNVCRTASNIRPNLGDYIDAEAWSDFKGAVLWAGGPNFDPAHPLPAETPVVPVDSIYAATKAHD